MELVKTTIVSALIVATKTGPVARFTFGNSKTADVYRRTYALRPPLLDGYGYVIGGGSVPASLTRLRLQYYLEKRAVYDTLVADCLGGPLMRCNSGGKPADPLQVAYAYYEHQLKTGTLPRIHFATNHIYLYHDNLLINKFLIKLNEDN